MKGKTDDGAKAKITSNALVSCVETFPLNEDQVVAAMSAKYKARKKKKDASIRKREKQSFIAPRALAKERVQVTMMRKIK